ncbi:MAG TPA: hypothetical protein VGF99_18640, partial [Myxococcota bacterium]
LPAGSCAPPVVDEDAAGGTVTVEKRDDGRSEIRSRPAGLTCDLDCIEAEHTFSTDVIDAVVVIDGLPGNQFLRAFCTATGRDNVVATLVDERNDEHELRLPLRIDGVSVDWRCVSEHLKVHTVGIFFSGTGSGSVVSTLTADNTPAGPKRIDCGDDCTGAYFVGDVETLTATPDEGSVFVRWNRCDDRLERDTDNPISLTVDADINCEAIFDLAP